VADIQGPTTARAGVEPSLLAILEAGEEVVDLLPGLGATLVVSSERVIVVREGTHYRPRNGVRSWRHGELRDVGLSLPRRGHGRIVLMEGRDPKQAVSVFIEAESWTAAERIVGEIRARARASHRSDASAGPAGTH